MAHDAIELDLTCSDVRSKLYGRGGRDVKAQFVSFLPQGMIDACGPHATIELNTRDGKVPFEPGRAYRITITQED